MEFALILTCAWHVCTWSIWCILTVQSPSRGCFLAVNTKVNTSCVLTPIKSPTRCYYPLISPGQRRQWTNWVCWRIIKIRSQESSVSGFCFWNAGNGDVVGAPSPGSLLRSWWIFSSTLDIRNPNLHFNKIPGWFLMHSILQAIALMGQVQAREL